MTWAGFGCPQNLVRIDELLWLLGLDGRLLVSSWMQDFLGMIMSSFMTSKGPPKPFFWEGWKRDMRMEQQKSIGFIEDDKQNHLGLKILVETMGSIIPSFPKPVIILDTP